MVYLKVSSYHDNKSLKIPEVQSGAGNQRKTDNIMAKKEKQIQQTTIRKTLRRKLKQNSITNPTKNLD